MGAMGSSRVDEDAGAITQVGIDDGNRNGEEDGVENHLRESLEQVGV